MAHLEISVVPKGCEETGISKYLVKPLKILEESGLTYEVHAMGTVVEGTPAQLFKIAERMHDAAFNNGVARVLTTITLDDRRDKKVGLQEMVASVLEKKLTVMN